MKCSIAFPSKKLEKNYNGAETTPNPLIIMALTTKPGLTISPGCSPTNSLIFCTIPISSIIPAIKPLWSKFSTVISFAFCTLLLNRDFIVSLDLSFYYFGLMIDTRLRAQLTHFGSHTKLASKDSGQKNLSGGIW
jgi:hypothetical protein